MNQSPSTPLPSDQELVSVDFLMRNGDRYVFPGVQFKMLWMLIRNETMEAFPQISVINLERACLTLHTKDLKQVLVDGQPFWTRKE